MAMELAYNGYQVANVGNVCPCLTTQVIVFPLLFNFLIIAWSLVQTQQGPPNLMIKIMQLSHLSGWLFC